MGLHTIYLILYTDSQISMVQMWSLKPIYTFHVMLTFPFEIFIQACVILESIESGSDNKSRQRSLLLFVVKLMNK